MAAAYQLIAVAILLSLSCDAYYLTPCESLQYVKKECESTCHGSVDQRSWYCISNVPNLICNPGFVRINGVCQDRGNCWQQFYPPQQCRPNESIRFLKKKCEPTCDRPQISPTGDCVTITKKNCICNPGYVRVSSTCLLPNYCPQIPAWFPTPMPFPPPTPWECNGPNESIRFLKKNCEPTCDRPHISPTGDCVTKTKKNCICNPGFVRVNNACLPLNYCPKISIPVAPGTPWGFDCMENEQLEYLLKKCEPTCAQAVRPSKNSRICATKTATCFCKRGYVRHADGLCRDWKLCVQCDRRNHESPDIFYKRCEQACDNKLRPEQRRDNFCANRKDKGVHCLCNKGYVRIGDHCHPWEHCYGLKID